MRLKPTGEHRRLIDAAMSEQSLQEQVIELASRRGWRVHHQLVPFRIRNGTPTAIAEEGTDPGFPDLVLAHPVYGTIFAELKSEKGKLSVDQQAWKEILEVHHDYRLWRPHDWPAIEAALQGE